MSATLLTLQIADGSFYTATDIPDPYVTKMKSVAAVVDLAVELMVANVTLR